MRFLTRVLAVATVTAPLALSAGCGKALSGVVVVLPGSEAETSKSFVLPKITLEDNKISYWAFTNLRLGRPGETDNVRVLLAKDVVAAPGGVGCLPDNYTKRRTALTTNAVERAAASKPPAASSAESVAAPAPPYRCAVEPPLCSESNPPYSFTLRVNRAVEANVGEETIFVPGVCIAPVKLKNRTEPITEACFRVCVGTTEVADPRIIIRGGD